MSPPLVLSGSGGRPAPTVLVVTPYDRATSCALWQPLTARGFTVVVAGVEEGRDPDPAVVDWVQAQPASNGQLITAGFAAEAAAAVRLAAARTDAVAAVALWQPAFSAPRGGPFLLEDAWIAATRARLRPGQFRPATDADRQALRETLLATPLADLAPGELATPPLTLDDAAGVEQPLLLLGSWYCSSAAAALDLAERRAETATLVMGPWVHWLTHELVENCALQIPAAMLPHPTAALATWAEPVLAGAEPERMTRTFVLGSHRWASGADLRHPGCPQPWYATPTGELTGVPEPPGGRRLGYRPEDPYPSSFHSEDHRDLGRPDVLRWASAPLTESVSWSGAARAAMEVDLPLGPADVVVTVLEQRPDGARLRLTDGASEVRADGLVQVELHPVVAEVAPGSRIVVEITGSRFPRFARALPGADRCRDVAGTPIDLTIRPAATGLLLLPRTRVPDATRTAVEAADAELGAPLQPEPPGDVSPLARLVDERTGVLTGVPEIDNWDPVLPTMTVWSGQVSDVAKILSWPADRVSMGMALNDPEQAWHAAVGEAIERYCGNFVPDDLVETCYAQLVRDGVTAMDPTTLALHAEGQYAEPGFPFVPFTCDLPTRWATGRELRSGRSTAVPASLVWVNYHLTLPPGQPTTNFVNLAGLAAGPDRRQAEVAALEEVIERDATTIWWHSGMPARPVRLDPATLADGLAAGDDLGAGWLASVLHPAVCFRVVAIPTTFDVSVVGVLLHDCELGVYGLGLAARPDPLAAARKALLESVALRAYALGLLDDEGDIWDLARRGLFDGSPLKPYRADRCYRAAYRPDWRDVTDLACHAQLWLDPAMVEFLGPLVDADASPIDLAALPTVAGDPWSGYLHRFTGRGLDPVSVDVTTPDVAAVGASVVRVVVPGTYVNTAAAFPLLGGTRLYRDPVELGWRTSERHPDDLVLAPLPHT